MSIYTLSKRAVHNITVTAMIALLAYCGLTGSLVLADEKEASQEQELRQLITGLTIEGLSLNLTPDQADETLISNGFQAHKGNEPGHGIYWKNEGKRLTKRIRLKSSVDRIYQIQFSFAEKKGVKAWLPLFNKIKRSLGSSIQRCNKATEQELNCLLVSEKPTQLSAEITTSQSKGANRIKVRIDQRTSKVSIKSNISFGAPKSP